MSLILNNFPNTQKILSLNQPFVLIDVGARRGFHPIFNKLKSTIKIGFEPEKKECDRLNEKKNINEYYYPVALSNIDQKISFYNSKNPGSSGVFLVNKDFFSRFVGGDNLEVTSIEEIYTTTLDNFSKSKQINDLDFLKIDTEGFDLMVLKGAKDIVNQFCLGVQSEVHFNPVHKNSPYFGKVHELMEEYGLNLYILEPIKTVRRKYAEKKNINPLSYGQVLHGEAVFLRDPLKKSKHNDFNFQWTVEKYKKIFFLYEIFNLDDCAIELIEFLDKKNLLTEQEIKKLREVFMKKSYINLLLNYLYRKQFPFIKKISKFLRKLIKN